MKILIAFPPERISSPIGVTALATIITNSIDDLGYEYDIVSYKSEKSTWQKIIEENAKGLRNWYEYPNTTPKRRQVDNIQFLVDNFSHYDKVVLVYDRPSAYQWIARLWKNWDNLVPVLVTWTVGTSWFHTREAFEYISERLKVPFVLLTHSQAELIRKTMGLEVPYTKFYGYLGPWMIDFILSLRRKVDVEYDYITVGRMVRSKGILEVVQAAVSCGKKLFLVSDPSTARTAADEKYAEETVEVIKSNPDLVHWVKYLDWKELQATYGKARSLLHHSVADVTPLVFQEALINEIGIVALNKGGVPESCAEFKDYGLVTYDKPGMIKSYVCNGPYSHESKGDFVRYLRDKWRESLDQIKVVLQR